MLIFTADSETLHGAITRAVQGLPSRPHKPVLAGMLFTSITFADGSPSQISVTASDEDLVFIAHFPAQVHETGTALLPGRMLSEMARYFPSGDIAVSYRDGGTADIAIRKSRFTISASEGKDYPRWRPPVSVLGTLDAAEFAAAVRKVASSAARNDPVLSTVCVGLSEGDSPSLTLACTDRGRLAVAEPAFAPDRPIASLDCPDQALVPVGVMERFARVAGEKEVHIGWDEKVVMLLADGLQVFSRQISNTAPPAFEGAPPRYLFPDWRKVLARMPDTLVTADTAELTRAVRMAQLATGETGRIVLTFREDGLEVSAAGDASVREHVDLAWKGEDVAAGFSAPKLLDGLGACGAEVSMGFASAGTPKPLFISSPGLTYMMQQMRDLQGDG